MENVFCVAHEKIGLELAPIDPAKWDVFPETNPKFGRVCENPV